MDEDLYKIHLSLNLVLNGNFTSILPDGPRLTQEDVIEELRNIEQPSLIIN